MLKLFYTDLLTFTLKTPVNKTTCSVKKTKTTITRRIDYHYQFNQKTK